MLPHKSRKPAVPMARSVKHGTLDLAVPSSSPAQDSSIQKIEFLVKILFIGYLNS